MKKNISDLVRVNVQKMQPYSSARDEFKVSDKRDMIFTDANENPFDNGMNRYPDSKQFDLKKKLAALKKTDSNQIALGNGSDEVIDLLYRVFCESNKDNVITTPPTYGMYAVLAELNSIENREVPLSSGFRLKADLVLEKTDAATKMIFICSPNNPTGNVFAQQDIEQILEQFNGIVVIDEAYIDFSEKKSWISKISKYKNLVVIQTLSKAFGMAGIRLGILYASQEIIAYVNKIKPPYNINVLTQKTALERIEHYQKVQEEIIILREEREKLKAAFSTISYIQKIYPTETNFILIKVDDANLRYQQLLNKGIVVRNRTNQPQCKNCLRISIGTPEENKQIITVFKKI